MTNTVHYDLKERYSHIRADSEQLCAPLTPEDCCIQSMPDVSPPKWHLAHTSWFFEQFLLKPYLQNYEVFHPLFAHIFNSYYESLGNFHDRDQRGLLARPTVEEIYQYRAYVDHAMTKLLAQVDHPNQQDIEHRTLLGLNHEQQHQELLLTDIKHIFAINPLRPAYLPSVPAPQSLKGAGKLPPLGYVTFEEGLKQIGHSGDGFAYDNETPRHKAYLNGYRLASRLVTNGEYREFIEAGAYQNPELWLSDGWKTLQTEGWQAPLYWEYQDRQWRHMTLYGMQPVAEDAPVCHVSFYEASAYARWNGQRLPREAEWEFAAKDLPVEGNLRDKKYFEPRATHDSDRLLQMFGDVWEWTQSPYIEYPGYRRQQGVFGEYNGKFMSNQMVLRGGSCVTPDDHIRISYRNFFPPLTRWQFSGIRLAKDI